MLQCPPPLRPRAWLRSMLSGLLSASVHGCACSTALPYFISIGFELPPNENPADFFLDIVSGCVPCQANPDFSTEVGAAPGIATLPPYFPDSLCPVLPFNMRLASSVVTLE